MMMGWLLNGTSSHCMIYSSPDLFTSFLSLYRNCHAQSSSLPLELNVWIFPPFFCVCIIIIIIGVYQNKVGMHMQILIYIPIFFNYLYLLLKTKVSTKCGGRVQHNMKWFFLNLWHCIVIELIILCTTYYNTLLLLYPFFIKCAFCTSR